MDLFKELLVLESEKASKAEVRHTTTVVNEIYKEWKKTKRRVNAVDIVTSSVNKLATIHPDIVPLLNEKTKLKLTILVMRTMDLPPWKPVDTKASIYKKLYPLMKKIQSFSPNTGSSGNLREVIMTRLSAAIAYQSKSDKKVFVAYEPSVSKSYLNYLFSDKHPEKTFKMQAMSLPEDYETLLDTLKINQDKAESKFDSK